MKKRKNWNLIKFAAFSVNISIVSMVMIQPANAQLQEIPKTEKQRIVLLTDIGGDVDDMQSLT